MGSPSSPLGRGRRRVVFGVAHTATLLIATSVSAQTLPPGQEEVVGRMLSVDACAFVGAQIAYDEIQASYDCDGEEIEVRLVHASVSTSLARTDDFAIEGAPEDLEAALLESVRAHEDEIIWQAPVMSSPPEHRPTRRMRAPPLTWGLALALVLLLVASPPRLRLARGFGPALLVILVVTLLVPDAGPLHDHLSFTARSDCALMPDCDQDRPGFFPPAYHLLELVYAAFPYRSATLWGVSLAFAMLALVFQHATLRELLARRDPRGHVALLATVLTGLNPALMRIAVAHSWYPMTTALLWFAALLCLIAIERDGWRQWAAAALALALAGTTALGATPAALVIGAAALLAAKDRRRALPVLAAFAFIGVHALSFLGEGPEMGERLDPRYWYDFGAYFDRRAVPLVVPYLTIGGAYLFARSRNWVGVGLGLAAFSMLPTVDDIQRGYPYLSVYPMLHISLALVATVIVFAHRKKRALGALALAAFLITTAMATESVAMLRVPRPLAAELSELERSWAALPPHRRLVIPPEYFPVMEGVDPGGDPVEVRFPIGFYRAAMAERGTGQAEVIPFDAWLGRGAPTDDTLVYLGTGFFTFLKNEIDAGVGHERPMLTRARDRLAFEPVHTFEVPADNPSFVFMRLGADRAPAVTVGFYRPRLRGSR